MNQQVATNLEKIIASLQEEDQPRAARPASPR